MMGDDEAVLFANDRFYAAFTAKDMGAMESLWAENKVLCIHPGWQPLYGREDVLESWRGILSEEQAPDIRCHAPQVTVLGDTAVVLCIEEIEGAFLCATNLFIREGVDWKLAHHHAGPVNMSEEDLPEEPEVQVN